ncbi:hypothetical protein [Desertibaculum subflavum]|uniref:hypothetical protein n=1 Tax=Desertibaculum subflavum TaxID=2268458 RepID=UPI0013C4ADE1
MVEDRADIRPEPRTVLNTQQARAGETSGRIRRVLSVSLAGTVLALAIAWALWIVLR